MGWCGDRPRQESEVSPPNHQAADPLRASALPADAGVTPATKLKNVRELSAMAVSGWVGRIAALGPAGAAYAQKFLEHEVDGLALLLLTAADLPTITGPGTPPAHCNQIVRDRDELLAASRWSRQAVAEWCEAALAGSPPLECCVRWRASAGPVSGGVHRQVADACGANLQQAGMTGMQLLQLDEAAIGGLLGLDVRRPGYGHQKRLVHELQQLRLQGWPAGDLDALFGPAVPGMAAAGAAAPEAMATAAVAGVPRTTAVPMLRSAVTVATGEQRLANGDWRTVPTVVAAGSRGTQPQILLDPRQQPEQQEQEQPPPPPPPPQPQPQQSVMRTLNNKPADSSERATELTPASFAASFAAASADGHSRPAPAATIPVPTRRPGTGTPDRSRPVPAAVPPRRLGTPDRARPAPRAATRPPPAPAATQNQQPGSDSAIPQWKAERGSSLPSPPAQDPAELEQQALIAQIEEHSSPSSTRLKPPVKQAGGSPTHQRTNSGSHAVVRLAALRKGKRWSDARRQIRTGMAVVDYMREVATTHLFSAPELAAEKYGYHDFQPLSFIAAGAFGRVFLVRPARGRTPSHPGALLAY